MSSPEAAGQQPPANNAPPKALPKRNPVAEMMGLPRLRLPSRNWLIFFTVTGAFIGAVQYDRREKRKAQKKWCDLVAHLSQEPLPINQMRRKLTVFLGAPPGDGLRTTRDYFREYIKPVLVAAAVDYDVIEGRKEGDVRYGTAEQIRRLRRKSGEKGQLLDAQDTEMTIELQRARMGIEEEPGPRGDIVIGRHAWKEYIRGLHEGWLGPLDKPSPPLDESIPPESVASSTDVRDADTKAEEPNESTAGEAKPVDERASYIPTISYNSARLAPQTPAVFQASAAIPQPHILGFFNTPIRIYRYLNERKLADQIGRETAAVVFGMSTSYHQQATTEGSTCGDLDASPISTSKDKTDGVREENASPWEQQDSLKHEEGEWHKSVRKVRDDDTERTWLDEVVIDKRIGERMRKFYLDPSEEERAERIGQGLEKPLGNHSKPEDRTVQVGNLDNPDG